MKLKPIVISLLDTDLYKFNMDQVIFHKHTEEKALNIVIKLQYVNGRPVAKLSDDIGKGMCRDEEYLEYLKRSVSFRLKREAGN